MSRYGFPGVKDRPRKQRKAREQLEASDGMEQLGLGQLQAKIAGDAVAAGADPVSARAYAEAVSLYLDFSHSGLVKAQTAVCRWAADTQRPRAIGERQAIPMVWDYAEANPFAVWDQKIDDTAMFLEMAPPHDPLPATVDQLLAQEAHRMLGINDEEKGR